MIKKICNILGVVSVSCILTLLSSWQHQIKSLPEVAVLHVIKETTTSVCVIGEIQDEGDGAVSEYGFYLINASGVIKTKFNAQKWLSGSTFYCYINELKTDSAYYLKAYAINDCGTFYSERIVLKMNPRIPKK